MKTTTALAMIFLDLALGNPASTQDKPVHYKNVTLVTDKPWRLGEARWCSFDGKYVEMHCFPPGKFGAPKTNYLVDVDFDKPVHFNSDNWAGIPAVPTTLNQTMAGTISCRLDSFKHATCTDSGTERTK
jgi:hypothetical protein